MSTAAAVTAAAATEGKASAPSGLDVSDLVLLKDVSFRVLPGEVVAVMGTRAESLEVGGNNGTR